MKRLIFNCAIILSIMVGTIWSLLAIGPKLVEIAERYSAYEITYEFLDKNRTQLPLSGKPVIPHRSWGETAANYITRHTPEDNKFTTIPELLAAVASPEKFLEGLKISSIKYWALIDPNGFVLFQAGHQSIKSDESTSAAALNKVTEGAARASWTARADDAVLTEHVYIRLEDNTGDLSSIAFFEVHSAKGTKNIINRTVYMVSLISGLFVGSVFLLIAAGLAIGLLRKLKKERKANYRSRFDKLTEIYLRKSFEDFVSAQDEGQSVALAILDVDNFKSFNDQYGHLVGDAVLKHVANAMRQTFPDDLLCRWAGDEFIVFITRDITKKQFAEQLKKLNKCVAAPIAHLGDKVSCSVSIGGFMAPWKIGKLDEFLEKADTALYHAKAKDGKGQFSIYEPKFETEKRRKSLIEERLQPAIKNNHLNLAFQPQYNVSKGKIEAFECLVRWHDEKLGQISPAEFIPIAEKSGLIIEFGQWVLEAACASAALWPEDYHICVNVSAIELKQDSYVQNVQRTLKKTGLCANRLEIELTESVLLEDTQLNKRTLNELVALGVQITIDGFGSANSSLFYLSNLPVSAIKIDRKFISKLGDDAANDAIVRAMIALAQELDIKVIAQGVETAAQRERLIDFGGSIIQGYFYGKPIFDPFSTNSPIEAILDDLEISFKAA